MTLIRTRYSERSSVPTLISTISRTKQSFKDECDINTIISRYDTTGVLIDPSLPRSRGVPSFGDFDSMPSYVEAQNSLIEAQASFDALPAFLRKRFSNSPSALLAFLDNADNYDEAVKLGLIEPKIVVDTPILDTPKATSTVTS